MRNIPEIKLYGERIMKALLSAITEQDWLINLQDVIENEDYAAELRKSIYNQQIKFSYNNNRKQKTPQSI